MITDIERIEQNRRRREIRHANGNAINEYNKRWYWEHLEQARDSGRKKAKNKYHKNIIEMREKSKLGRRKFELTHPGYSKSMKEKHAEYYKQYNKIQKDLRRGTSKYMARLLLHWAILKGKIGKPNKCSKCGRIANRRYIHGHHFDYSKPLEVIWLCVKCHTEEHRK
jgi:predicted ATP-dependent endonuclease of OLD family